jgi:SAM-dependent methyltransferase
MAGPTDYTDGTYLQQNPGWHVADSAWKAGQILRILDRNRIEPNTVYDMGCGAGEVLRLLQQSLSPECELWGADVSPHAIELAQPRANAKLHFGVSTSNFPRPEAFDLVIAIDILAHVEDYRGFLRALKSQGTYKLLHIPLDISVQHILREKSMAKSRQEHPHLHYFSRSTVMFALADIGYEIVESCFTPRMVDVPAHWKGKVMRLPRKFLFAINQNLAATLLGGFSLMVLAR